MPTASNAESIAAGRVSAAMSPASGHDTAARRSVWIAAALLVLATMLAYANSLSSPFVLDDDQSIAGNPSIRQLWPPWSALSPPRGGGLTVEGRPMLNLSLAVDYALHGTDVRGYHLGNLAIHVGAGLLLFGLIRRTLRSPLFAGSPLQAHALSAAFSIAALWLLHPLQTEAVTYVIQRAESLGGFFYLLALYAFLRQAQCHPLDDTGVGRAAWRWSAVAVGACALGMATKEVMASAPLIVLLYDRTFVAGSFRAAWRERRGFYGALGATWLLLALLVAGFHGRSGSAGFGGAMTSWHYALTQCRAVLLYLKLAFWPDPLVFDYGTPLVTRPADVAGAAAVIAALLLAVGCALRWRPVFGFLGLWFFAVLAPSSSVVPVVTQTIAEHRMYLALAPLMIAVVGLAFVYAPRAALVGACALAAAAGFVTHQRNEVYRSHLALWTDTVAKQPTNTRARNDLALVLRDLHRPAEALLQIDAALAIEPGSVAIHNNRANVLADLRRYDEALAEIDGVIAAVPNLGEAYDTKGEIFKAMGREADAERLFARAVELNPALARGKK